MSDLDKVLAAADAALPESLERMKRLVAIPSISTDPAYKDKVRDAANWLRTELQALGFDTSLRETPGHPVVIGHDHATPGPRVVFYGHYDVQPVDPLELWHTDPFTATLVEGDGHPARLVGRGTSDDKGQLLTFIGPAGPTRPSMASCRLASPSSSKARKRRAA